MKLTSKELQYVKDQDFLLTKLEINKKVLDLMGEIEHNLHSIIPKYSWPDGVLLKSGKISRGELYRGLPYYVLDYPRSFKKEGVFAFRTMCWWGNFFSGTWHISGKYLDRVRPQLIENLANIKSSDAFVCVNGHPWDYHYQPDNYVSGRDFTTEKLLTIFENHPFVKLSYRWELENHANLPELVSVAFEKTLCWFTD